MPEIQQETPADFAAKRKERIDEARTVRAFELLQQAAAEHAFGDDVTPETLELGDAAAVAVCLGELARRRKAGVQSTFGELIGSTPANTAMLDELERARAERDGALETVEQQSGELKRVRSELSSAQAKLAMPPQGNDSKPSS